MQAQIARAISLRNRSAQHIAISTSVNISIYLDEPVAESLSKANNEEKKDYECFSHFKMYNFSLSLYCTTHATQSLVLLYLQSSTYQSLRSAHAFTEKQ